jgi:hypothetical protein
VETKEAATAARRSKLFVEYSLNRRAMLSRKIVSAVEIVERLAEPPLNRGDFAFRVRYRISLAKKVVRVCGFQLRKFS